MATKRFLSFVTAATILVPSLPAKAELQLNPEDIAFCNAVHSEYIKDFAQMNSTKKSGGGEIGLQLPIFKIPIGISAKGGGGGETQNSTTESIRSSYESKNCDVYIQTQGKVKIAEIEADAAIALAEIAADTSKYGKDVELALGKDKNATDLAIAQTNASSMDHRSDNGLLGTKDTNATNLAIEKVRAGAQKLNGILGNVGNTVGILLSRPRNPSTNKQPATPVNNQTAALPPPTTVAVAPSDPVAQQLAQWGWTKVPCAVGAVFIKGLSAETVCINPTGTISAGEYTFDRATNQLQPVAVRSLAPIPAVSEEVEELEDTADEVDESYEDAEDEELESEDFEEDL